VRAGRAATSIARPESAPRAGAASGLAASAPSSGAPRLRLTFEGRLQDLPASSGPGPASPTGAEQWLLDRYRRLGVAFLDGVRGDFAVTLVDDSDALELAARDGLGNAYLAYRLDGGHLAAAGDAAELLGPAWPTAELDPLRWSEFFAYQEVSGPETFFRDVRSVLPGEMVLCREGRVTRRELGRPRLAARVELPRWEDYVGEFAARLERAVERAIEDVPSVAVWLSGGLDSSPIAALAARAGRAVDGLVWDLNDPGADDFRFAAAVAAHAGFDLHRISGDDALPFHDLARWPVPRSTPEQVGYRWLHQRSYRRAAELGHRVVLNGFGGDMLYGNARRWFWDLWAAEGPGAAFARLRTLLPELGAWRAVRSHVLGPLLPRRRSAPRPLPGYLTPRARGLLAERSRWPPDLEEARRPRQAERLLSLLDSHGYHVERQLAAELGLQVRSPLRDRELVELLLAVPDHLLLQGNETRPVLRAACAGLLPEVVRQRRGKAHFRDLFDRGLRPENLPWAPELLLEPGALWRDYVQESEVRRWLAGHLEDNWDRLGFVQCLASELWRYRRAGGDLADLVG